MKMYNYTSTLSFISLKYLKSYIISFINIIETSKYLIEREKCHSKFEKQCEKINSFEKESCEKMKIKKKKHTHTTSVV